ncbi:chemotaxis protein CheD [bacterium]|nr:chemotaxis protein CheD [bacterium]
MDRSYAFSGELRICKINGKLSSGAIGSCIAVIMIDMIKRVGAMAHIMLSGKAPEKESNTTKYTCNAISGLYGKMIRQGASDKDIRTFIFGGANVLRDSNANLPESNIASVKSCLKELKLKIEKESVGGFERREVILDMKDILITCSIGDAGKREFWASKHGGNNRT